MKIAMRALFALAVIAAGATTQLSCSVNDYCLNCETGDGGMGGDGGDGDGGMDDGDGGMDAGCVPTGTEVCDGKDNDCNGITDDGVLPGVGDPCANQNGICAGGVQECRNGALKCNKSGMPELCNGLDDNCDSVVDDNDPGLPGMETGRKCGKDDGECIAGITHCNSVTHQIDCVGEVDVSGNPELCDGKDNDCNSMIDDNVTDLPPSCGPPTDVGACEYGTPACQGGAIVCLNAVFPKFETCNGLDDDCNNMVDEGFNTATDPKNCGMCGVECPAEPHANPTCALSTCGYACQPGYHDLTSAAGCEYGPCFASGVEVCDGLDNDCNGLVDDDLTPPSICRSGGECGMVAPIATCEQADGWTCEYTGDTQFPETKCDGKNNDCDANIDEGQQNLGQACDDGNQGVCRSTGVYACNAAAPDGPAVCDITSPGQAMGDAQETCDAKDNDCDGAIDEGSQTGDLLGQEWVDIGGNRQIMKYEASRFDASSSQQGTGAAVIDVPLAASPTGATQSGSIATFTTLANHSLTVGLKVRVGGVGISGYNGLWTVIAVPTATSFTAKVSTSGLASSGGGYVAKYRGACSRPGVMPWTNVTYPEALAACESMGATLCTETRWHQACSVVSPQTTPIVIDGGATGTAFEAEDFTDNVTNGDPETGTQCANAADDDGDGFVNEGCPTVTTGIGPETDCTGTTDDDNDGIANDGCPAIEVGTGSETGAQCSNTVDDDGDGRVNDGCPVAEVGTGSETGAQCSNATDDDGDGRVNDGCPTAREDEESGAQCNNDDDDDGDGRVNDGCPPVGANETGSRCTNNDDDDGDGYVNDGCPVRSSGTGSESGGDCNDSGDDDGDGVVNDGCPPYALGAGGETFCTSATDNDDDGFPNDGCPPYVLGEGPETGTACNNSTDNDGDGVANDGCPAVERGPETGNQCTNATDDDNDGVVNDGCPSNSQAWIEDYTTDEPSTATNEQASGIGNMRALPNTGASIPLANALAGSPRLDYQINIPTTDTTWRIHVRMFSPTGNDDALHLGIGATVAAPTRTLITSNNSQWVWMSTGAITLNAGVNTLSLFMAEDGLKVDRIFIVRGTTSPPTTLAPAGGTWSYATNPTTYQGATCNGADQSMANDNILPAGALASCYADHGGGNHVHDMSGNVKEWTLARNPGQNPIRGGASNDLATGISCALNFNLGSDTFFFPNVGFRCCR